MKSAAHIPSYENDSSIEELRHEAFNLIISQKMQGKYETLHLAFGYLLKSFQKVS